MYLNETHKKLSKTIHLISDEAEKNPASDLANIFFQLCDLAEQIDHARKWDKVQAFNLLYFAEDLLAELSKQQ